MVKCLLFPSLGRQQLVTESRASAPSSLLRLQDKGHKLFLEAGQEPHACLLRAQAQGR